MEGSHDRISDRLLAKLFPPNSKLYRVFRHRDYRLLWIGAFLSFIGGWIQNIGQGVLVYDITGNKEKLALITLFWNLPVLVLGPFAGGMVDTLNKKKLLVWTQILLAAIAFTVGILTWTGNITFNILLFAALANGVVSCFEMPVRQAMMSASVPKEDVAIAIPVQGFSFNLARVVGPALASLVLANMKIEHTYIINGFSYLALIFAALAVKTSMAALADRTAPMFDLILEGFRYMWREPRLKTLFLIETLVNFFALFYLAQMPAIAKDMLGLDKDGVGYITTAVGVGAVIALITNTRTADLHIKGNLIKGAVFAMAVGLALLSQTTTIWVAMPVMVVLGMSSILIFNLCNSLMQLIAPEQLRGRVISVHVWALSGLGSLGVYPYGWLSEHYGLRLALQIAAVITLAIGIWAYSNKLSLEAK